MTSSNEEPFQEISFYILDSKFVVSPSHASGLTLSECHSAPGQTGQASHQGSDQGRGQRNELKY